jgi:hypothetical protein
MINLINILAPRNAHIFDGSVFTKKLDAIFLPQAEDLRSWRFQNILFLSHVRCSSTKNIKNIKPLAWHSLKRQKNLFSQKRGKNI